MVDRLLASPHYGERWAQHWLDLVRYSETEGFKKDGFRQDAYRYRDYVIRAFNDDLPYDRFVREQMAGDELEPNNPDALVATGLIRLYPEDINASNLVQQRQEILDDITENTGLVFLGLTVGCAGATIISSTRSSRPIITGCRLASPRCCRTTMRRWPRRSRRTMYQKRMDQWEQVTKPIRGRNRQRTGRRARSCASKMPISAYDPETLKASTRRPSSDRVLQKQLVAEAEEWIESRLERAYRRCPPEERKLYDQQMAELAKFDELKPEPLPTAMTMTDADGRRRQTCVLRGGNYLEARAKRWRQVSQSFWVRANRRSQPPEASRIRPAADRRWPNG